MKHVFDTVKEKVQVCASSSKIEDTLRTPTSIVSIGVNCPFLYLLIHGTRCTVTFIVSIYVHALSVYSQKQNSIQYQEIIKEINIQAFNISVNIKNCMKSLLLFGFLGYHLNKIPSKDRHPHELPSQYVNEK